jgi:hypothetical protein
MRVSRLEQYLLRRKVDYPCEAVSICPSWGCGQLVEWYHYETLSGKHRPYIRIHRRKDNGFICSASMEHFDIPYCFILGTELGHDDSP